MCSSHKSIQPQTDISGNLRKRFPYQNTVQNYRSLLHCLESLIHMTAVCCLVVSNRDLTRALKCTHDLSSLCRLVFAVNLHISHSFIMDSLFRAEYGSDVAESPKNKIKK